MSIVFSDTLVGIDWEKLADVSHRAPLGERESAALREAFANSSICCFVFDSGELVGAGRALSDGVWHTLVVDVVLLPEYQGQGLGKAIMKFLADRSQSPKLMLYSAPGKEGFYAKIGYRKMKTAIVKCLSPETVERYERPGYIE
jgi:aralkylamine N-acetyltransferase